MKLKEVYEEVRSIGWYKWEEETGSLVKGQYRVEYKEYKAFRADREDRYNIYVYYGESMIQSFSYEFEPGKEVWKIIIYFLTGGNQML